MTCADDLPSRDDKTELAAMLGVPESELGEWRPRFNIAPAQPYFILRTKYENREALLATRACLIVAALFDAKLAIN